MRRSRTIRPKPPHACLSPVGRAATGEKNMIVGAHCVIYSRNAELDRAFIRDVLRFPKVDVGGGWLIFGLPPSEVAIHPGDRNTVHEFYLLCRDIEAFAHEMQKRKIPCDEIMHLDWGSLTRIRLPGGGKLGIYEPHHARPRPMLRKKKRGNSKRRAVGKRKNVRTRSRRRKAARTRTRRRKPARTRSRRRKAVQRTMARRGASRRARRRKLPRSARYSRRRAR
jgi:hypothetical protein